MTPLLQACRGGQLDIAKYLIEKGADPEATNGSKGGNSLYWAREGGSRELIDYIFKVFRDRLIINDPRAVAPEAKPVQDTVGERYQTMTDDEDDDDEGGGDGLKHAKKALEKKAATPTTPATPTSPMTPMTPAVGKASPPSTPASKTTTVASSTPAAKTATSPAPAPAAAAPATSAPNPAAATAATPAKPASPAAATPAKS